MYPTNLHLTIGLTTRKERVKVFKAIENKLEVWRRNRRLLRKLRSQEKITSQYIFSYKSNARENQDLFILSVLNKKRNGTYVEIGAEQPIINSNTFLLENEFGWRGISFEWDSEFSSQHLLTRKTPCVCADATTINYDEMFQKYSLGPHIDFLQLDIDPPSNTFKALNQIDFSKYSFSVVTYEHDLYAGGKIERESSRRSFESYGYTRVISDVMNGKRVFEDWYVNERHMPNDAWKNFVGNRIKMNTANLSKKHIQLFNELLQ